MPPKATPKPKKKKKRGRSTENENGDETKKKVSKQRKPNHSKTKPQTPSKWPRGLRGPKGMKLKQLQYHKFENDILIYHYCASFLTVPNLRSLLNRHQHGYVNYLLGPEPLSCTPTPPGDEPPPGCLEVGYLPSVFQLGGSALGFRLPTMPPTIEWLCFDQDINTSVLGQLDINTSTQHMLFEHVGTLPRAPAPEKKWDRRLAYTEHKDWFESLREAGRRPFKLGLTWKTWGTELMVEGMRKRDEQVRWRERLEMLGSVVATDAESDGYSVVGEGDEEGEEEEEEEEQDTRCIHRRDPESPKTNRRHTSFVHRDPVSKQDFVLPKPTRSRQWRSSSNASMLSDRSTNTPRTQPASSTEIKSKEQLLLDGRYV